MWRLDGNFAHLETVQLACGVDLLRPADGLLNLSARFPDVTLALPNLKILQIHTGETERESTLSDVYVRGTDLVATYRETSHRHVRPQFYWRWVAVDEQAFGLEVILSVETSELDVRGTLETESILPVKPKQLDDGLHLCGLPTKPYLYVEMAHPSNLIGSDFAEAQDLWRLKHQFFAGHLEKGVIHRAMVRGMFLTRGEPYPIERLYHEFLAAAPPLTT